MADWHVIENSGRTLVALIERRLKRAGIMNVTVGLVTAAGFEKLAVAGQPHISLFLFQIAGNPEMRNLPETIFPDGTRARQPLPLELSYLVTAWGVRTADTLADDMLAAAEEARLLGLVLQACYDGAELSRGELVEDLGTAAWATSDALQVAMQTLPVDQHYRIWDAAELGYRLSLVYRVRVASLEPTPPVPSPPVTDAALEMAE